MRIVSTNKKLDLDKYEADVCIRLGPGPVRGNETYSFGADLHSCLFTGPVSEIFRTGTMARILDGRSRILEEEATESNLNRMQGSSASLAAAEPPVDVMKQI